MATKEEPILLISDGFGCYIPQMWAEGFTPEEAAKFNIPWWCIEQCQAGPDSEHYWDAWNGVLDNATLTDDRGQVWYLHQDGDLWQVPEGWEWPED